MSTFSVFADHLCRTMDVVSWQATVLVLVVAAVSLVFRRAPANFRYLLWCLVLLRLCVPVDLSLPDEFGSRVTETANLYARPVFDPLLAPLQQAATATARPVAVAMRQPQMPQTSALALLWLCVVGLAAGYVSARGHQARRLLRQSTPLGRGDLEELAHQLRVRCGIRRSIKLGVLPDQAQPNGPCVAGIIRPCILLPRQMAEHWALEDLEPVLLHELAHVKRHDLLVNLVQIVVQVVYFFHPLVWLANWRIRALREEVCDDIAVLQLQHQKKRYGSSFLRVIEETQREPALALCPFQLGEVGNPLGRRVVRIMSKDYVYHRKLSVKALAALAVVALVAVGAAGITGKSAAMARADELFDQGQYAEAAPLYRHAYEESPGTRGALFALVREGLCYARLEFHDPDRACSPPDNESKAIPVFEEAVQKFSGWPGSEEAWFLLGEAYDNCGLSADAIEAWRSCIEQCRGKVQPDQFPWRDAAGGILLTTAEDLFKAKDYPAAIDAYTRIYQEMPDWKDAGYAMMMVGICYGCFGEPEKRLQALEQAAQAYPDQVGWSEATWYYLGAAYEDAGRSAEALDAYTKSVDLASRCESRKPDGFPWADAAERIAALQ